MRSILVGRPLPVALLALLLPCAGTPGGLFRLSPDGGAERLPVAGPGAFPLRVSALAASGGRLWIGTDDGAHSVALEALASGEPREARWHPLVFGDPPAQTNVVTALAPLGAGAIAGTDDGGVVHLSPGGEPSALRFAAARANEVNPGAAVGGAGMAYVGTQGGGLVVLRGAAGRVAASRPAGWPAAAVSALAAEGERLLVGTANGMVLEARCPPGS